MNATAVSKIISPMNNHIIIVISIKLSIKLFPSKDISKCPAIMLAVSRTASDVGRIILLIDSIITINGIKIDGVPMGTRWQNIWLVLFIHPNNIKANHLDRAIVNENLIWEDAVKIYGKSPIRLLYKININILTKIIEGSIFFICKTISNINFLLIIININNILFGVFQKLRGMVNISSILSQFIDKIPVAGSNTENKLVIIFNL